MRYEKKDFLSRIIFVIAVIYALFNLYAMTISSLDSYIQFPTNLLFSSVLALLIYKKKNKGMWPIIVVIIIGIMAVSSNLYMSFNYMKLIWRPANLLPADLVFAIFAIIATLVITKMTSGWALPIVAMTFVGYAFFGKYLPGVFNHSGYSFQRIIYNLYSENGLYGQTLATASTFVFLFCLFGAFLEVFSGGQVFIDLATGLTGRFRGGPAKVAVIASCFFGSISGSSIANVVGTGTFTIPLMKKTGYKPYFAAAVEAVSSTGGQIMPPVMGSTAFILCEIIGVSYSTVAIKALIPALLYYFSVFVMVDLEAVKLGLRGLDKSELPNVKRILFEKWPLLLPLIVMLFMLLFIKSSPAMAAVWSIVAAVIAPLINRTKIDPKNILVALEKGANGCIGIVGACATAGLVISVLALTGLGVKIGNLIVGLSGGNLILILIFAMIVSIILGMGLPTPAAYVICASVVSTPLSQAGLPPILAHMFIFYFSILAVITPPVAMASYTAAGIAGANANKVGFTAVKLGLLAFIVPYMFVLGPALLLEGTVIEIIIAIITASCGVFFLGSGLQGWFRGNLVWWQRGSLIVAALLTIYQGYVTDIIGFGIFALVALYQLKWRNRVGVIESSGKVS